MSNCSHCQSMVSAALYITWAAAWRVVVR